MPKKPTGRLIIQSLCKFALAGALLAQAQVSFAAVECHFMKDGTGATVTLTPNGTPKPLYFHADGGVYDPGYFELGTYKLGPLSPTVTSHCDAGKQGEALSAYPTNAATFEDDTGYALYPTNVDYIYYAVNITSSQGGGYFTSPANTWTTIVADRDDERWDNVTWYAEITLYERRGGFGGNMSHVSYITPKDSRTLGQMSIGGHTDSDNQPITINVTPSSFSIPVPTATCQTVMVNNGTNNVDFGELMFSDFRAGREGFSTQNFDLQLRGCSNVVSMNIKLQSNKTANNLMTNTIDGGASGIGVQLQPQFLTDPSTGVLLVNRDPVLTYAPDTNESATWDLGFIASMLKDGSELKAGEFRAIGTFMLEYF